MSPTLWLSIVFLSCALADSISYENCPSGCSCERRLMTAILSCHRLITEKDAVADIPYSQFQLTNFDEPITLEENVFVNMGLMHVNYIEIVNGTIESVDKNAFKGLKKLTHIKIAHSNLKKFDPETFKLPKLQKLNLIGNPLENDIVIIAKNLDEIKLAHCGLNEITADTFKGIPAITLLDLTGNGIETLPENTFDSLKYVKEIILAHNKLKQIPKNLFAKNENMDILDLGYNFLTTFSSESVRKLEVLSLRGNLLTEIDMDMFKNMSLLYNLDLSENKIASIDPEAFAGIPRIATIYLSHNELRTLDENLFAKNIDLQILKFDNNYKLSQLPVNGFQAPNTPFSIHYFSCNNCGLQSLAKDTFKNMPNLVTLYLAHNNLQDISTGVFQSLVSLIELDLSDNKITTINENTFHKNTNMNKLNLSFNTLKSLHTSIFKNNENLKILDISNCGLYQLWTGTSINNLPSILSLNASYNNIALITKEDISITNRLHSLDISNNSIQCSEDLQELIVYLEDQDIKNNQYITHEEMSYGFEAREKDENNWNVFAKTLCPGFIDDYEQDEMNDEDDEEYNETTDYEENEKVETDIYNDSINENEEDMVLPYRHAQRAKINYYWLIIVFLGTALLVLGLVANLILFILRRKQTMPVPRIINGPRMSRLKKNSGLVYQQLSEEHGGSKTPILSRFAPIPAVHGNHESEHV